MAWQTAVMPEIVRRIDDASTEVIQPNTVYDAPPGERIGWMGNPSRKRNPPLAFAVIAVCYKLKGLEIERGDRPGCNLAQWLCHLSAS